MSGVRSPYLLPPPTLGLVGLSCCALIRRAVRSGGAPRQRDGPGPDRLHPHRRHRRNAAREGLLRIRAGPYPSHDHSGGPGGHLQGVKVYSAFGLALTKAATTAAVPVGISR
eukprot:2790007-Pyramimonas_sp.AAC.1